jgi:hypothetical protein
MDESDIESGRVPFQQVIAHGAHLFTAVFNRMDGFGRPGTTNDGLSRPPLNTLMLRTAGPDAHSCVSCHNEPRAGGSGDFPTNVFVMAESASTVTDSLNPNFVDERNTVGVFGAGPLEMLARQMTHDLQATRTAAITHVFLSFANVPAHLQTKGIDFGWIVARPDGSVDSSGVVGVNGDLVVRPFHQHGAAVSLRQFSNEGMNQHLGIQSQELFGIDTDPDGDGVRNELTVGNITALAVFQAQLAVPGRIVSVDPAHREAAEAGEALFNMIGCTDCHVPAMRLNSRLFTEPNPFNPEWLLPVTVANPVSFDMTVDGEAPRLRSHCGWRRRRTGLYRPETAQPMRLG